MILKGRNKGARRVKIVFCTLSIITIVGFILCLPFNLQTEVLKIYIVTLFFATSLGLQITLNLYLSRIKRIKQYKKDVKALRIISYIISSLLFLKGVDFLIVYLSDKGFLVGHKNEDQVYAIFNILRVIFYFLETGPSIVVCIVLWKLLKEYTAVISRNKSYDEKVSSCIFLTS